MALSSFSQDWRQRWRWGVLVLFVAAACISKTAAEANTYIEDSEHFPGWKGVLPVAAKHSQKMTFGELGKGMWTGEVQQLSWKPRAYLLKQFLSNEECDQLVAGALKKKLEASEVVDSDTGAAKLDTVRTSYGTFYNRGENELIKAIEKRISHVTFLPVANGEGIQILRYQNGQKYEPHHDFFWDKVNADPATGGQRIMTVLMYLTTPEDGGETVFPRSPNKVTGTEWSECAKQGLAVKAIKGDALMFYSLKANGEIDEDSEHGSCATTKGTKFSATKWIHVGHYLDGSEAATAKGCVDSDAGCEGWAFEGECTKNPGYMLENCRKSCDACGANSSSA